MLHLVAHVRQVGTLGAELPDDVERLLQSEMGGVRLEAQGVEHQNAQPFQMRPTRPGYLTNIGAISDIADAKSQYVEMRMDERNGGHPLAEDTERFRADALEDELGDHAGRQ